MDGILIKEKKQKVRQRRKEIKSQRERMKHIYTHMDINLVNGKTNNRQIAYKKRCIRLS